MWQYWAYAAVGLFGLWVGYALGVAVKVREQGVLILRELRRCGAMRARQIAGNNPCIQRLGIYSVLHSLEDEGYVNRIFWEYEYGIKIFKYQITAAGRDYLSAYDERQRKRNGKQQKRA